jgi:hypothetical protein
VDGWLSLGQVAERGIALAAVLSPDIRLRSAARVIV